MSAMILLTECSQNVDGLHCVSNEHMENRASPDWSAVFHSLCVSKIKMTTKLLDRRDDLIPSLKPNEIKNQNHQRRSTMPEVSNTGRPPNSSGATRTLCRRILFRVVVTLPQVQSGLSPGRGQTLVLFGHFSQGQFGIWLRISGLRFCWLQQPELESAASGCLAVE